MRDAYPNLCQTNMLLAVSLTSQAYTNQEKDLVQLIDILSPEV